MGIILAQSEDAANGERMGQGVLLRLEGDACRCITLKQRLKSISFFAAHIIKSNRSQQNQANDNLVPEGVDIKHHHFILQHPN